MSSVLCSSYSWFTLCPLPSCHPLPLSPPLCFSDQPAPVPLRSRVYRGRPVPAVYAVDGYRRARAFLVTRRPAVSEYDALWGLVWEQGVHAAVLVGSLAVRDGNGCAYSDQISHFCLWLDSFPTSPTPPSLRAWCTSTPGNSESPPSNGAVHQVILSLP